MKRILRFWAMAWGWSILTHSALAAPVVSHGLEIDLRPLLTPGKNTIVDFFSTYCSPCRSYAEPLDRLHELGDIAVLKVDVNRPGTTAIDWRSPVLRQFGIKSLPHFKVFDASGRMIAEGPEARKWVDQAIRAHRKKFKR